MFVPLNICANPAREAAAHEHEPERGSVPALDARGRPVFPAWVKKRWPAQYKPDVRDILHELKLNTVCHSAQCPNISECWHAGTATFMLLGNTCTRSCSYCDIQIGRAEAVEHDEPERVAEAVRKMGVKYVVLTSVARDDLKDGGAAHWAATIRAIRSACDAKIEILTTDFSGRRDLLQTVLEARPDVFNHNIETVERLFKIVRRQFNYEKSLRVLQMAREIAAELNMPLVTKSGFMVGMGESDEEVHQVLCDLREHQVDLVTVGQYLQPRNNNGLPVARFVHPDTFADYTQRAQQMGFAAAECGTFVRSSYKADEMFAKATAGMESATARTSTED